MGSLRCLFGLDHLCFGSRAVGFESRHTLAFRAVLGTCGAQGVSVHEVFSKIQDLWKRKKRCMICNTVSFFSGKLPL